MPLRIAILEADTPAPPVLAAHGRYGAIFAALLQAGAFQLNPPPALEVSAYDVVEGTAYPDRQPNGGKAAYPEDDEVDAVLLTGSRHDAFANDPWIETLVAYTHRLLTTQSRIRVLGVCFGHQIAARALGARVARSPRGWELAVVRVQLSEAGRRVFGQDVLAIHQMHQDDVLDATIPQTQGLGTTPRCATQGFIGERLLTLQGHPEFTREITQALLDARVAAGKFGREVYDEATARCGDAHDGVLIARAFLAFVMEGQT